MVLSSNWLKLQETQKVHKPSKGKVSKTTKRKDVISNSTANNKKGPKGKKNIMGMVHSMNHEIEKIKERKLQVNQTEKSKPLAAELEETLEADAAARSINRASEIGKYVAIDCEFVGVGPEGKDSALARATVVNYFGHVVLDVFVKPQEKVTDWRTWVSGVRPQDMKEAVPFSVAQAKVAKTLENRILVGHSVAHDLQSLFLSHPRSAIRDTSRHLPFRKQYAGGKTPSLKKLAKEILGIDIQGAEHSPIEDARATMLIYKSDRKEFERLHQIKFGTKK
ncbi:putative 3'-5' exonuclease [Lachancea thermotolerans CBS 6340]|uniref:RNA exonuclease 4 n=1 Tax=Lachancea thermotolerans (strain ATCC 56472 / CBS 6340 / NRRL Y-8284) TaxID=559295 RepID=C5DNC7_LACTC|nr:KLTH0G15906p [Lachancea thermotolerans CBS 6340]CAR25288.1 KLTH0G15906p [Lachancea thermotolerans CBS 6340]